MKTICFTYDPTNPHGSLENFKNLLCCMNNPIFDSARLIYDSTGSSNPEYPLVFRANSSDQEVKVAGVSCGPRTDISNEHIHPYTASATLEFLKAANFKVGEAITNMILFEPKLNVTIWNNIE